MQSGVFKILYLFILHGFVLKQFFLPYIIYKIATLLKSICKSPWDALLNFYLFLKFYLSFILIGQPCLFSFLVFSSICVVLWPSLLSYWYLACLCVCVFGNPSGGVDILRIKQHGTRVFAINIHCVQLPKPLWLYGFVYNPSRSLTVLTCILSHQSPGSSCLYA